MNSWDSTLFSAIEDFRTDEYGLLSVIPCDKVSFVVHKRVELNINELHRCYPVVLRTFNFCKYSKNITLVCYSRKTKEVFGFEPSTNQLHCFYQTSETKTQTGFSLTKQSRILPLYSKYSPLVLANGFIFYFNENGQFGYVEEDNILLGNNLNFQEKAHVPVEFQNDSALQMHYIHKSR